MMKRTLAAIALALSFATSLAAQTPAEVSYADDFQSYGTQANPTGWIDTSIAGSTAQGLYKTWSDPTGSSNVVYGTRQSSGKPEGNNPRIGTFSTLTTKAFAGKGRFEYRGRFIRTSSDTHIGLTFFSSYPEKDSYYLLGTWGTNLTMQLFAWGGGVPVGTLYSGFTPEANRWYQFLIQADDSNGKTSIRARFWADGTKEPDTFSIDAVDSTAARLTGGRIGIWSAVKGDAYVDDLTAKSPVDHTPPVIAFVDADTNKTLDPALLALFKSAAHIDIRVTDDLSKTTFTATLDGAAYTAGTPITADGPHTLAVHAVDAVGNATDATLKLLVDGHPPVVTVSIADGAIFAAPVVADASATDLTKVKLTATLDGAAVSLPVSVASEKVHTLVVTATDEVGWTTTVTRTFTVDLSDPVIAVSANGAPLGTNDSFSSNVTLTWSVLDLTLNTVTATLDGTPVQSGVVVSTEAIHKLVVTATDKAGHTASVERTFALDKTQPEVHLLANGDPFVAGTTFNKAVSFDLVIRSATPTTTTFTIDGSAYVLKTPMTAEGRHSLHVVVKNAAGLTTEIPASAFTIDLTKPVISLTVGGQPFANGMKFKADVKPLFTATDNLSASPERRLFVDGKAVDPDATISDESVAHTISAEAEDDGGNVATVGPFSFVLDKSKPVVVINTPDKDLYNVPVTVSVTVTDITATTTSATLTKDGAPVSFDLSTPVSADGAYVLTVTATDALGWTSDPVTKSFTIDRTAPRLAFTAPAENAVVSTPTILAQGTADDAVTITINGRNAIVDSTAKTFALNDVALLEGTNELAAHGVDKAGNPGDATLHVVLDTRAPDLTVTTAGGCTNAASIEVRGTVLDSTNTIINVAGVAATVAADHTWSATVPLAGEGSTPLLITATDAAGHTTTATLSLTIDRTKPLLDISESGAPFTGGTLRRKIALLIRATDADVNASVTSTLDGAPYVSGAVIGDGAHTLAVTARDCAGNVEQQSISFTIDTVAPRLVSIDPADGTTIGVQRAITGTTDADDLQSVTLGGTAATLNGRAFTFASFPLVEGINHLPLVLTDRAGNTTELPYTLTLRTAAPVVELLESGAPLAALYNRIVTPTVRVSDATAAVAATLNGAAYTVGTPIANDGAYTLAATATDSLGHHGNATASFTIDRTPPTVTLTTPAPAAQVDVHGLTTGGDVASVTVNGVRATLAADGSFAATIALDLGPNTITAVAVDRAGNAGSASVEVTRANGSSGIILTAPADGTMTNRPAILVAGQLLTPGAPVTLNGTAVSVDPAGVFRRTDFPLVAGDNAITAASGTSTFTVHVVADFTPPALRLLANGLELADGARFATSPQITIDATDANLESTTITLDGAIVASVGALPDGGHSITAVARDRAGNESRVSRTFVIGASSSSGGGCTLSGFDPADGAVVYSGTVRLTGRSGGASSITVNGNAAQLADGSFQADVTLQPGRNTIEVACGATKQTLTIFRYTDATITIAAPQNDVVVGTDHITVSGTVSDGVATGDVNGLDFTPQNGTYSVPNVALANGLNVIAARARTRSGAIATTSIRVRLQKGAPQIVITTPLAGTQTGAAATDLSGAYANIDPATLAVTAGASSYTPQVHAQSDTTGTFSVPSVALAAGATTTINVTGANKAGDRATASVDVQNVAGGPSISITSPADNSYFASTVNKLTISGTVNPPTGMQVQVNGVTATLGDGTFTADLDLTSTGVLPVVARVTAPDGGTSVDSIRITRFDAPLTVQRTFPAANATSIDAGISIVAVFSNAIASTSLSGALTLKDATGATLDGEAFVDRNSITFAPLAPLTPGMHYTFTIGSVRDLAGGALAQPYVLEFTTASTAPATAPVVDQSDASGCFRTTTISGKASVAGAIVRIDVDGLQLTTTANDTRVFSLQISFSGQSGFHVVRVRELGADGSLSPERDLSFRINCAPPQVLGASLDRSAKKLAVQFSKAMNPATLAGAIHVDVAAGAPSLNATGDTATLDITSDLTTAVVTLTVTTAATDTTGAPLAADYSQTFTPDSTPAPETGKGYFSGAVYDAATGRPLAGATIDVQVPVGAYSRKAASSSTSARLVSNSSSPIVTDARGRYTQYVAEGAYTIKASRAGYTTAWRQVVVPAGEGIIPIDIRLTPVATGDVTAKPVTIDTTATGVTVTPVGGQSLAGLLPLGWSPLAAAEVAASGPVTGNLAFALTAADVAAINAANQHLTVAQYDSDRDEWRVIVAAAQPDANNRVVAPITTAGDYALVYADAAATLAHPPVPVTGASLEGVATPCVDHPEQCQLQSDSFVFTPTVVLPSQSTVANLVTKGATQTYPSGTALQAFIDEELDLADGRVLIDPPFATDVLVYRTLAGDKAEAHFAIAPTAQAASVTLRSGVDHVRIVDYPGRIDRGALIGTQGGRVPGDGTTTIDIPTGATDEPVHATVTTIAQSEWSAIHIAGFTTAGGFDFNVDHELLKPARATFNIAATTNQVVVVEVLGSTPFGTIYRLAALATKLTSGAYTTAALEGADGVIREGRYLVLTADTPVDFAYGTVRYGSDGPAVAGARVTSGRSKPMTNALGVTDLSRATGRFVVPVAASGYSLVARALALGDGDTIAGSAPSQQVFDFGVLPLVAQRPNLVDTTPHNGAVVDPQNFFAQAKFDVAIDPASVAGTMIVNNLTTGASIAGSVAAQGQLVTFTSSAPLPAGGHFALLIGPSIRALNATPFGQTVVIEFTTAAIPANDPTINPAGITITMPDANGRSLIRGTNAIPANDQVVAVRRGHLFRTTYQATVDATRSFSFSAGAPGEDAITLSDKIDLQVIDSVSHGIIAIIPLTPFVTADGNGFLAAPDAETKLTTKLGVTVTVPAGAFSTPTIVSVSPVSAATFAGVPQFDTYLHYATGVHVDFAGMAQKRIDVELPLPADFDSSKTYFLGSLGQSMRGPRVEIIDTLRVDGTKLTTTLATSSQSRRAASQDVISNPADVKAKLLGIVRAGDYSATSFMQPVGWVELNGIPQNSEVYMSTLPPVYASALTILERRGRVLMPAAADKAFTVDGVDAATGLDNFKKIYNPIPAGDPGAPAVLPSPADANAGPYPVYASPSRIELVDVPNADVEIDSVRGLKITLLNGNATIAASSDLPADSQVSVLNIATGGRAGLNQSLAAQADQRLMIAIEEKNADPATRLQVVFSEPLYLGDGTVPVDDYIKSQKLITLKADGTDMTSQVTFAADPGAHEITLKLNGPLQSGRKFTIVLSDQIATVKDNAPGLRLGQIKNPDGSISAAQQLELYFTTRAPGGSLGSFNIQGGARDLARFGNIAFVAALDGGLQAYDLSDPVALTASGAPIATVPAGATQFWSVAIDRHGRIYSAGLTSMFGVLRSYRVEDFVDGTPKQISSGILSWAPGTTSTLPLGSEQILSDRPEGTPRKIRLLLQDDEQSFDRDTLKSAFAASNVTSLSGGYQKFDLKMQTSQPVYAIQRVTVENRTLALHWSVDVPRGQTAQLTGIIAAKDDDLYVVFNRATYGVISLFGYGVGVFDLNAIEANDHLPAEPNYKAVKEVADLYTGDVPGDTLCNQANTPSPCPIRDLSYSPESIARGRTGGFTVYALEQHKGMLDVTELPPPPDQPRDSRPGLVLTSGNVWHPRLVTLKAKFQQLAGSAPIARYTSVAYYAHNGNEYALIAADQLGVLVAKLSDTPLNKLSLVDIIWIPAAAQSVRVEPGSDVGVVVDGAGRVLLIDLTRIDQSSRVSDDPPADELYPSVKRALNPGAAIPGATWMEVGLDDDRILWKSEPGLVKGTLTPLFDPQTGIVFTGDVNTTRVNVVAATDPHLRVLVDSGTGSLSEAGGIVPLGIAPPAGVLTGNGSLAAFRIEVGLPGSITKTLNQPLVMALDNERVPGAKIGTATEVTLTRFAPIDDNDPKLKYQEGFNRFLSPWIVAVADPRAAKNYAGPLSAEEKTALGCASCARPAYADDATEINSTGRFFRIRAKDNLFSAPGYSYLNDRVARRVSTIMADTVRPTNVLTAANAAPAADGALLETTYVHSGEVESSAVDLVAGGRAGWDVSIDRLYRSRTFGSSFLGIGWDSSMFRRLRQLPNGDVEYRDGAELWLFRVSAGAYTPPVGLNGKLTANGSGWSLVDQKGRIEQYDSYGRVVRESDEFFDGKGGGNAISYLYDALGRLGTIIDPVGRKTTLTYFDNNTLKEVQDWRGRTIDYHYGADNTLQRVELPPVTNMAMSQFAYDGSNRPTVTYGYDPAPALSELAGNLKSIQQPADTQPRVTFDYNLSGPKLDMVAMQKWQTTDAPVATFDYTIASIAQPVTQAVVTDAMGQKRTYTFTSAATDAASDRVHVQTLTEAAVDVWAAAEFGNLPAAVSPALIGVTPRDRVTTFGYEDGRPKSASINGGPSTTLGYEAINIGKVVKSVDTAGGAGTSSQTIGHNNGFVTAITADGQTVDAPEASRNTKDADGKLATAQNDGDVQQKTTFGADGLVQGSESTATAPNVKGAGSKSTIDYYDANDTSQYARALPKKATSGDALSTTWVYKATQTIETAPRNVVTTTDYDEWRRPVHIKVTGADIQPEEWFGYDKAGRLKVHRRKQTASDGTAKYPEEQYDYDILGRLTEMRKVDGATVLETSRHSYNIAARNTTDTLPGGAVITHKTDGLGREIETVTDPKAGDPAAAPAFTTSVRYDIAGNAVFSTDGFVASAVAFDSAHRPTGTISSDGTSSTMKLDGFGRTRQMTEKASDGTVVSTFAAQITPGGKVQSVDDNKRHHDFAWDAAGRTNSTTTKSTVDTSKPPRGSTRDYDLAGRLVDARAGVAGTDGLAKTFDHTHYDFTAATNNDLPAAVHSSENGDAQSYVWKMAYDTLGRTKSANNEAAPDLAVSRKLDESGNVTVSKAPDKSSETTYDYDARGFQTARKRSPNEQPNHYTPDASGVVKEFTDPKGETTSVVSDGLGRPLVRTYPDTTTEEIQYDGMRVHRVKDRENRWQELQYNAKGQLEQVMRLDGGTNMSLLDRIEYDEAGRLKSWKTPESLTEFSSYDLDGHPQITKQSRLNPADGTVIDSYTQNHAWNGFGERIHWEMPTYSGIPTLGRWTRAIDCDYDAMGNLRQITRDGTQLLGAEFRTAGRPITRTLDLGGGRQIIRSYDYDQGGRLNHLDVKVGDRTFAGSTLSFEGLQRKKAQQLGVSNGRRSNVWSYDDRGRVSGMIALTNDPNAAPVTGVHGAVVPTNDDADFRSNVDRTPAASADPSSMSATPTDKGHKIDTVTRGGVPEKFKYAGGSLRREDGRFTFDYDEKQRLIAVTDKILSNAQSRVIRRRYIYNGLDRLIGRRVEVAPVVNGATPAADAWTLATPDVVAGQSLPAAVTFVWDPISDELVAIFPEGASNSSAAPLWQFIHGGSGLDDVIEIASANTSAPLGVAREYPLFDEPGNGSMQAIVREDGTLERRTLATDPWNEDERAIVQPAVERIELSASKDGSGTITSVDITMRLTEAVSPTTIAGGVRLAAVAANGTVITTSDVQPTTPDVNSIRWTLTPAQWSTLTAANPAAISIAATNTLRSATFGPDVPFMAATPSGSLFTLNTLPFELREPLSVITARFATSTATYTPFDVPTLPSLATRAASADTIVSMFQGLPFADASTGLVYARARWYDPAVGAFLTPDPMGYKDSSNLYAFAGGDPVNGRDPSGEGLPAEVLPTEAPGVEIIEGGGEVAEGGELLGVEAGAAISPVGVGIIGAEVVKLPFRIGVWWNEYQERKAVQREKETQKLNASRFRKNDPTHGFVATEDELNSPYLTQLRQARPGSGEWVRLKNLHLKWVEERKGRGSAAAGSPPSFTPQGAGRSGAFRKAKQLNGIPASQQPTRVVTVPDRTNPGKTVTEYHFNVNGKDVVIRDDRNGHVYPDDPSQNRGPHFNDPQGRHYDY